MFKFLAGVALLFVWTEVAEYFGVIRTSIITFLVANVAFLLLAVIEGRKHPKGSLGMLREDGAVLLVFALSLALIIPIPAAFVTWQGQTEGNRWTAVESATSLTELRRQVEAYSSQSWYTEHPIHAPLIAEARLLLARLSAAEIRLVRSFATTEARESRSTVPGRPSAECGSSGTQRLPEECGYLPAGLGVVLLKRENTTSLIGTATLSALPEVTAAAEAPAYVAYVEENEWNLGKTNLGGAVISYRWNVWLVDVRTQEVTTSTILDGTSPDSAYVRNPKQSLHGDPPTAGQLEAWIRRLAPRPERELPSVSDKY